MPVRPDMWVVLQWVDENSAVLVDVVVVVVRVGWGICKEKSRWT